MIFGKWVWSSPFWTWDTALPETQGLVGFQLHWPLWKELDLNLFLSPFFAPSQTPSFELQRGLLGSSNPWFTPPIQFLNFSGQRIKLNYSIKSPSVWSVGIK